MDEPTKQAVMSAVRSLLIVAGGSLATHGIINEASINEAVGAIMVLLPLVWGIINKFTAEKKAVAREVVAVQAGVTVAATGSVGPVIRPADAKGIIEQYSASAKQPTTGESNAITS